MGHSSKKKKRDGGGSSRQSKGRTQSKDHASQFGFDDYDQLSEEITALPYSKDMGYEDLDVSAVLAVRCLPGYPFKCPKLQITLEKGLSEADAKKLLSLLQDQATLNAREGRVMIYNLVEAAQEFLSGIEPIAKTNDSKLLHSTVEKQ